MSLSMSPRKRIPSLALIHFGLRPVLVPSSRLSFMPFHHPFPLLSTSTLTECILRWSINCSAQTTTSRVMGWDDLLPLSSPVFPSLFNCPPSSTGTAITAPGGHKMFPFKTRYHHRRVSPFRVLSVQGQFNLRHRSHAAHSGSSSHQETQLLSYGFLTSPPVLLSSPCPRLWELFNLNTCANN